MRPIHKKTTQRQSERQGAKRKATSARRKAAAGPREHLRRLVDELPEAVLPSILHYAAYLRDRGPWAHVEEVDEPLSAEELAGIEEGRREYLEGKGIPIEDVYRELVGELPN